MLHADQPADLRLDGRPVAARWTGTACRIPSGGRLLSVERAGEPLLGSPIDLGALAAADGFIGPADDGGLTGVGRGTRPTPDRDPAIEFRFADGSARRLVARTPQDNSDARQPLARLRRFTLPAGGIPPGPVQVWCGRPPAQRQLWGSPIDPGLERRTAAGMEHSFNPVWANNRGIPPAAKPPRPPVDVVVPVYRGLATAMACLRSVLPTLPAGSRLHVVDDGAGDAELGAALDEMAASGSIVLHRLAQNRGFPCAANTGLRAARDRDVVLLNSDTVVPPGWLQRLADAAHSAPGIGAACPLSNDRDDPELPGQGRWQSHGGPGAARRPGIARQWGGDGGDPRRSRFLHVYAARLHRCRRPC